MQIEGGLNPPLHAKGGREGAYYACFDCSMRSPETVKETMVHKFGDPALRVAAMILSLCERLVVVQAAYQNSDGENRHSDSEFLQQVWMRPLSRQRILGQLRTRIGCFWYASTANNKAVMSKLVEESINHIVNLFENFHSGTGATFPEGLEVGLVDGERSSKYAAQVFQFQHKGIFQSPKLRVIFNDQWLSRIREIIMAGGGSRSLSTSPMLAEATKTAEMVAWSTPGHTEVQSLPYCVAGVGISNQTTASIEGQQSEQVEAVLRALWQLSPAERDAVIARANDDRYLGLSTVSNDTEAKTVATFGQEHLRRICFEIPCCVAILPKCQIRFSLFDERCLVHVVVFHDVVAAFRAADEDFIDDTTSVLLAEPVEITGGKHENEPSTKPKKTTAITLSVEDLVYFSTFEEIESCSYGPHDAVSQSRRFADAKVAPMAAGENATIEIRVKSLHLETTVFVRTLEQRNAFQQFVGDKVLSDRQLLSRYQFSATFPNRRADSSLQRTATAEPPSETKDTESGTGRPQHTNTYAHRVKFFACGKEYFSDVAHALLQARSFIMLRDWQLNATLPLKRGSGAVGHAPGASGPRGRTNDMAYRLHNILHRKAKEGVKVYVLVYRETALFLGSEYSEDLLESLHENIVVLRHGPGLDNISWSHHDKSVNIDGCIAYIGGLDMAVGRYDTQQHPLWDVEQPFSYPGADYHNWPDFELDSSVVKHLDRDTRGFRRMPATSTLRDGVMVDPGTNIEVMRAATDASPVCGSLTTRRLVSRRGGPTKAKGYRRNLPLAHRLPWHDVQCSVVGMVALDHAKSFIHVRFA